MSTVVLVDFSQTVIAAAAAQADELKNNPHAKSFIKHLTLTMLIGWKKRFGKNIILACDADRYWRRDEYPWYKGHRKHEKAKNDFLDWDLVDETVDELIVELRENFMYKVLKVEGAEADDVIACLVKYFQENELEQEGLIEEPMRTVIISTDGDFQQLQKYQNVEQWHNIQKKFLVCANPKQTLIEKVVRGDAGDNIPSITTGDEWSKIRAEGGSTRAAPFKTARLDEFYHKFIDACKDENERRNYLRNERFIDLDMIPDSINSRIVKAYLDYEVLGSKQKIFTYLMKNKMKLLAGSASEF